MLLTNPGTSSTIHRLRPWLRWGWPKIWGAYFLYSEDKVQLPTSQAPFFHSDGPGLSFPSVVYTSCGPNHPSASRHKQVGELEARTSSALSPPGGVLEEFNRKSQANSLAKNWVTLGRRAPTSTDELSAQSEPSKILLNLANVELSVQNSIAEKTQDFEFDFSRNSDYPYTDQVGHSTKGSYLPLLQLLGQLDLLLNCLHELRVEVHEVQSRLGQFYLHAVLPAERKHHSLWQGGNSDGRRIGSGSQVALWSPLGWHFA